MPEVKSEDSQTRAYTVKRLFAPKMSWERHKAHLKGPSQLIMNVSASFDDESKEPEMTFDINTKLENNEGELVFELSSTFVVLCAIQIELQDPNPLDTLKSIFTLTLWPHFKEHLVNALLRSGLPAMGLPVESPPMLEIRKTEATE
jgi:hypothetical protein